MGRVAALGSPGEGCLGGEAVEFLRRELLEVSGEIDRSNEVPQRVLDELGGLGLLDPRDPRCLLEAVRLASYSSRGVAHVILVNGASKLAVEGGEGLYALSITEPGGGTDIRGNLATRAVREGDAYRVEGEKIFTSNALYATHFLVLAAAEDLPALFICPRGSGIRVEPLDLSGFRGSGVGRVYYRGAECTRVTPPGVDGVREALRHINLGRLGYASIALGIADRALDLIIEVSRAKRVFGASLIEYQGIRWMVASISLKARALEALVSHALGSDGAVDPEAAAAAKVMAGSLALEASWAAVQVMGGRGLSMWGEAERMYRDSKVIDIGEGAREVLLDYLASREIKRRATTGGAGRSA